MPANVMTVAGQPVTAYGASPKGLTRRPTRSSHFGPLTVKILEKVRECSSSDDEFEPSEKPSQLLQQGKPKQTRSNFKLTSLVVQDPGDCPQSVEEGILAKAEAPELNKDVLSIAIAIDSSSLGLRSIETFLPFVAHEERALFLIRCTESSGKLSTHDPEQEMRTRCEALSMSRDLVIKANTAVQVVNSKEDTPLGIHKKAKELGVDLIVVASCHNGGGALYGHVCDAVVRNSSVPVCVVRPGGPAFCPKAKLLVLLDGGVLSLCAFRFACRLATAGMEVHPAIFCGRDSKAMAMVKRTMETVQMSCVVQEPIFPSRNYEVTLAQDLLNCADEMEADFIVVGSETKGYSELGSLESSLIYQAKCNVIVYRDQWLVNGVVGPLSRTSSWDNPRKSSWKNPYVRAKSLGSSTP